MVIDGSGKDSHLLSSTCILMISCNLASPDMNIEVDSSISSRQTMDYFNELKVVSRKA